MEEIFTRARQEIDREIGVFLDNEILEAKRRQLPELSFQMIEDLKNFILRGGKRLRPFLFYYGYILSGGTDKEEALKTAIALEFLHVGLIIQDDVMDRDSRRHGGLSVYAQYEEEYSLRFNRKDLRHFGYSMAICASDVSLSWSFKILAGADFEPDAKTKGLLKLSEILTETSFGQALDEISQFGEEYEEKLVYLVQDFKTARYTIVGPLELGAIMAGASESELGFISDFATPLGIAYQIQDDILGVFGDAEQTGKPVGADLREGKKTLLISHVLSNSSQEDGDFVRANLGKEDMSEETVMKIREIMQKAGSLKYSEDKALKLMQVSSDVLEKDTEGFASKYSVLKDFAEYLLNRKK